MKVVIIGSGNVATVFGKKMLNAGHEIIQVAGRNIEKVTKLASYIKASYTTDLSCINPEADIYIISVSDSAIQSVASQLRLNRKIVVHTAAAVSKNVLSVCSDNFGVLYPLQTLKGEITALAALPLLIDANHPNTLDTLMQFSVTWADSVVVADDEKRLKLHVAAVFVNNFTNHLFVLVEDFCNNNEVDFRILEPIIKETVVRIKGYSPSQMQTGPAVRKDLETIEKHEKILEPYPGLLDIYKTFTHNILNYYSKRID